MIFTTFLRWATILNDSEIEGALKQLHKQILLITKQQLHVHIHTEITNAKTSQDTRAKPKFKTDITKLQEVVMSN